MTLQPGESLAVLRVGKWRMAVPLVQVERILSAALPVAVPSPGAPLALQVNGAMVPILFGAALLGAEQVEIGPEQKMLLLAEGERRLLLWVDAVEDITAYEPCTTSAVAATQMGTDYVATFSGGEDALAVLDPSKLLHAALSSDASLPSHSAA